VESDFQLREEFFLLPICPDRLTVAPVWLAAAVTQPDCEAHRPLASVCIARIWIRAWSFGCGMGDHGRIPCCSMFRQILGLLKLTILQILGGEPQSRMARLNIYLFSMLRIGMRAPSYRLTLFAIGTGRYSKCMRENVCISASINFAMYGKWVGS
jgi:hypothetical protein